MNNESRAVIAHLFQQHFAGEPHLSILFTLRLTGVRLNPAKPALQQMCTDTLDITEKYYRTLEIPTDNTCSSVQK